MSAATAWSGAHFIAGDVALDFANTVYRRTPEIGADLLNSTDVLTAWLRRARLLPAFNDDRGRVDGSGAALREARGIRELFWVIFEAQMDGRELPADAVAGLVETARHRRHATALPTLDQLRASLKVSTARSPVGDPRSHRFS